MIGVYWETWSDWKSNLKDINDKITVVYISFADPRGSYKTRQNFTGTGISASKSFDWYVQEIKALKSRGVRVMLSVGGGTYPFPDNYNGREMTVLANDLGCDGIDIDWENGGVSKDYLFSQIIVTFRESIDSLKGSCKYLSAACWSTGCMLPVSGDTFKGMNIKGIVEHGSKLDWINIMTYDCGPPSLIDPKACYWTYRVYYKGLLCIGFQPGLQAWGGYLITMEDVIDSCNYVAEDHNGGAFVWSWQKDSKGSPSVVNIVETSSRILNRGTPSIPPAQKTCKCPNCGVDLALIKV